MDHTRRQSKTFVLGAGFSAAEQFPLVFGLRERVVHFLEAERHSAYSLFLQSGNGGFAQGQFYAGLETIDPVGSMHFEETLIALRQRLDTVHQSADPCHITRKVLGIGCARLLWCIHNFIWRVSACYSNFATWAQPFQLSNPSNAIISFNWDLLAERTIRESLLNAGRPA
jgi:hypothetical protein